jgi:3-oxoadipate enol-lactonase
VSRALVLTHAFPVGSRLFEPQRNACPGWHVITPPFPGFDFNPVLTDASIDAYAGHVLDTLDELGVDRAVFGGVSMGGYCTFSVLRQARERVVGIVLANTRSAADTPDALEGRDRLLQAIAEKGPAAAADAMIPRLLGKTSLERRPDIVARVREMTLAQTAEGISAAIRVVMSRPDSTPLLKDIRVPALVVAAEEDVLTPPLEMEQMAAAIPRATFVRIPEAGHLSNLENPDAFNSALNAFLATV